LSSLQIAHQNIKPENLILTDLHHFTFKFCDITSGIETIKDKKTQTWNLAGSVGFMSPELYENVF
jgi:serine/threonine protein kinase